jgi:hypothetical protein
MGPEVIVATLVPLTLFGLVFGIYYIRNKENMALIERGINPRSTDQKPRFFVNLKWGLLMTGAGLGLMIAYFVDLNTRHLISKAEDNAAIYMSLIAIGGGLGLVISYLVEKKHWDKVEKISK